MTKILIIEDDLSINKILQFELTQKDYDVEALYDGEFAVEQIIKNQYDLVLVDWMLPKLSGIEIIEQSRNKGYLKPMILLTARSEENDIIKGLEAGADDYLTKPFHASILMARIDAHIRRYYQHSYDTLSYSDIKMDISSHDVYCKNEKIILTKVEYDLLMMFLKKPEKVLSRQDLLMDIWKFDYDGDTRLVDIHIFKLKSKLKNSNVRFQSVRGVGYKLVEEE
ncbi:response regulator transcription factor [Tannockella kyphosi]|uniref:response regulator transcription factor n=1 Tax=Tannockella kyphosi TaxID=2899121 RepID=UPI002012169C|nr:response regulator transcription factor [Tannockella kyphosi]